tara:strand:- start:17 stop:430 length:414 start_codon:yes stop_codon:yes gene_type:complete
MGNEEIGRSPAYFAVIKKSTPALYRYMKYRGKGNMIKGYCLYSDYDLAMRRKINDFVFQFEKDCLGLANFLYNHGYTSHQGYIKKGNIGARSKGHQVSVMKKSIDCWIDYTCESVVYTSLKKMKSLLKALRKIKNQT